MQIVVLDGLQMNPGDLDWGALSALGKLKVFDRTAPDEVISRSKDADVLVINKVKITPEVLDSLPNLKMIAITATGYDNVEIEHAKNIGVVVSNAINYSTPSVTQYVFACIFDALQGVASHAESVRKGEWSERDVFSYTLFPINEWHTRTLGIIGLGNIGTSVANFGQRLGMKVIAWNRSVKDIDVELRELDEVISESDFLSLHLPLNSETFHLMDRTRLNAMKTNSFLINAGRGPLVDINALISVLDSGVVSGAYLDVLPEEPPLPKDPVLQHPKIKVTPHLAWCSVQARQSLLKQTVENIEAFIQGQRLRTL